MKKRNYSMLSVFAIVGILSVSLAMAGSEIKGDVKNFNQVQEQTSLAILGSKAYTGAIVLKDAKIKGNVTNNNRAGKQTSLAIIGSTAVTGSIVAE